MHAEAAVFLKERAEVKHKAAHQENREALRVQGWQTLHEGRAQSQAQRDGEPNRPVGVSHHYCADIGESAYQKASVEKFCRQPRPADKLERLTHARLSPPPPKAQLLGSPPEPQ